MYAIGKLLPFLTPRHRRTGLASVLVLIGYLLAAPALAQVAGLCGPGKICKASAFKAFGPPSGTASMQCMVNGNGIAPAYGWARVLEQMRLSIYDSQCIAPIGNVITLDPIGAAMVVNNWSVSAALGFDAPRAFASFPAAASSTGRLLFDSTNSRWRQARSSTWLTLVDGAYDVVSFYVPANAVTGNPVGQWLWSWTNNTLEQQVGIGLDNVTVLTAGVGAGNITYSIWDVSAAAYTSSTVTIACTAAAGTVASGTGVDATLRTLSRTMQLRVSASACGTNPVVNATIRTVAL